MQIICRYQKKIDTEKSNEDVNSGRWRFLAAEMYFYPLSTDKKRS